MCEHGIWGQSECEGLHSKHENVFSITANKTLSFCDFPEVTDRNIAQSGFQNLRISLGKSWAEPESGDQKKHHPKPRTNEYI